MVYVSQARRRSLKRLHMLACPSFLGYPLNNAAHVRAAAGRYAQKGTRKCKGGLGRIRRAEKKFGIDHRQAREVRRGMRATMVIR